MDMVYVKNVGSNWSRLILIHKKQRCLHSLCQSLPVSVRPKVMCSRSFKHGLIVMDRMMRLWMELMWVFTTQTLAIVVSISTSMTTC